MKRTKNTISYAFTLIELLVVIAIIAIIAAILFPVFASAREKARQTTCASDEKQMGLGFLQYAEDYDEHFPGEDCSRPGSDGSPGTCDQYFCGWMPTYPGFGWSCEIYPYVKATQAYTCPDDPHSQVTHTINGVTYPSISYAMNMSIDDTSTVPVNWGTVGASGLTSSLSAPASTVLLVEDTNVSAGGNAGSTNLFAGTGANMCVNGQAYGDIATVGALEGGDKLMTGDPNGVTPVAGSFAAPWYDWQSPSGGGGGGQYGVHTQGSNYLLADGHVKFLKATQVSFGVDSGNTNAPENWGEFQAAGVSALGSAGRAATFAVH